MDKINLQLFSFGHDLPMSLQDKIRCAAEMGYTGVEFAGGYDDIPVEEMKKVLADNGIEAVSAHVALDKLDHDLPYLAELGVKYIICPSASFNSKEEAKELAEDLNAFGKKCAQYGIKTGYHNHTEEYFVDDGKYILEWLMEYCDEDNVIFEIDCGWCSAAGVDPVEFINAHKGRIAAIHIKENNAVTGVRTPRSRHDTTPRPRPQMDENGRPIFPKEFLEMIAQHEKLNGPQGQGIVDWKAVKAAADAQWDGVTYVVEREGSYNEPKDRIACLKEDIAWLKANV